MSERGVMFDATDEEMTSFRREVVLKEAPEQIAKIADLPNDTLISQPGDTHPDEPSNWAILPERRNGINGRVTTPEAEEYIPRPIRDRSVVGRSKADYDNRDRAHDRARFDRERTAEPVRDLTNRDFIKSLRNVEAVTAKGTRLYVIPPFQEAPDYGPKTRIPEAKPGRLSHSARAPRR